MKASGSAVSRPVVGEKSSGGRKTLVLPKIESRLVTRIALSNYEIVNGWQKTTGCRKYSIGQEPGNVGRRGARATQ